jgi:hypothetical protein
MDNATSFPIISKGDTTNTEYLFELDGSDKLKLWLYDDASNVYIGKTSDNALTSYEGSWVHVSATYDGSGSASGISLYVNGQLVSSSSNTNGSYTAMNNEGDLDIGREFSDGTTYANGQIDEVKLYNYKLTSQQIKTDYNQGAAVRWGPSTGSP